MFTHGATASNQFIVKNTGGTFVYSNDGATTGVSLSAGASAWAAVSDKNKKENLVEVSYSGVLERVSSLPVYEYNFIGNPKQQKCIGPTAQDWHSIVTPLDPVVKEIEDPENEGETITIEEDAKNKLSIETMDVLGVCLASIKALKSENEKLKQ